MEKGQLRGTGYSQIGGINSECSVAQQGFQGSQKAIVYFKVVAGYASYPDLVLHFVEVY